MTGQITKVTSALALAEGDLYARPILNALRGVTRDGAATSPVAVPHFSSAGPVMPRVPVDLFRPTRATREVRNQAQAWLRAHEELEPGPGDEEALLHAAESAAVIRPPVPERSHALDSELAWLYLRIADRWIQRSATTGDFRFLNAAMKITASAVLSAQPPGHSRLAPRLVWTVIDTLERLRLPALPGLAAPRARAVLPRTREQSLGAGGITVLAGEHSGGVPLFLDAARSAGFPIRGVVLHSPGTPRIPETSAYANAWYPAAHTPAAPATTPPRESDVPRVLVEHKDWGAVARQVREWNTGLLVLLGMDIVPAEVLEAASTATVNAHNGALPGYRGMDAVAWALLAGEHPVCSVHIATAAVDAGDVLDQAVVPGDHPDLRRAVKRCQIRLLADVCSAYATTGRLPSGRIQEGPARRYYRMHPALRRVLDQHFPRRPEPAPSVTPTARELT